MSRRHLILDTPTGPFAIVREDDGRLRTCWVEEEGELEAGGSTSDDDLEPELADRLRRYFGGEHVDFGDFDTPAGSPFFARCWEAARRIPRGQTRSYLELARMAGGTPGSARAAGQAMRHNPLPIVVPCHRVIGSGGELHGFAGSTDDQGRELDRKRILLDLEIA